MTKTFKYSLECSKSPVNDLIISFKKKKRGNSLKLHAKCSAKELNTFK